MFIVKAYHIGNLVPEKYQKRGGFWHLSFNKVRNYNFSREKLFDIPSTDNITFDYTLAFLRRGRIALTTYTKPTDFVPSELPFPSSYFFCCFSRKHSLMHCLIFLLPLRPHIIKDVKVIGASLMSSLSISNQALLSLTVRAL